MVLIKNNKEKVFEVCNEGCELYSKLVEGYYSIEDVIYNEKGAVVSQEEILIRDLFTGRRVDSVSIDGIVSFENDSVSSVEFLDKFLNFVESNGWEFAGGISEVESLEPKKIKKKYVSQKEGY